MSRFQIKDYELGGKVTEVTADSLLSAMQKYLPWPTPDVSVDRFSSERKYRVVDRKTDFVYDVVELLAIHRSTPE